MKDFLEEYREQTHLQGIRNEACRVIGLVHYYGRDVSTWTSWGKHLLESTVTRCYWGGIFHETGQICSRCSDRRRNRIVNGKPCYESHIQ